MKDNYLKYLSNTSFEERWGLYVTTVGCSKVEPHELYPKEGHPQSHQLTWNRGRILEDFYIIFVSKGSGVFRSAKQEALEVSAGTCFFLFPGIVHRYRPHVSSGWEEYWVGFNGSFAEHLISNFFKPEQPLIDLGMNKDLLILFNNLLETIRSGLPGYPLQAGGILVQILGLIRTAADHQEFNDDPVGKLIAKAKFMIQESFDNEMDMEKLAAALPMGYSSFRKSFKRITGISPNQYHLQLRLERAKSLLRATALNINEIADQVGFDSVFYFSKLFKKKNGFSPKYYRNKS